MKVTTDACLFGAWCALEIQKSNGTIQNILDIGTGTGLLSLMVAQQCTANILAIEIDTDATAQSAKNFATSPWAPQLKALQGDIRLLLFAQTFDVIISNPPFYEKELTGPDPARNAAHHGSALKLGELLDKAGSVIAENGSVFLLLPGKRKEELKRMLETRKFFINREINVHPSEQHPATRWMISLSRQTGLETISERINIRENDRYSERFVSLLQNYYLQL